MSRPREMRLYDHDVEPTSRTDTPAPGHDVTEPIDAGLGWVRVRGGTGTGPASVGVLTDVELVTPVMARMHPDRVADHLVAAINSAQQSARKRRITPRR